MVKSSFWLILIGILVGQLFQLPIAGRDVPVLDFVTAITAGLAVWKLAQDSSSRQKLFRLSVWRWLIIWLGVFGVSWLVGMLMHPGVPVISGLYWLRVVLYGLSAIWFFVSVKKTELPWYRTQLLYFWLVFAAVGFIQLVGLPNLELLEPYGWDPHRFRLFATWLDPNFAGAMIGLGLGAISLGLIMKNIQPAEGGVSLGILLAALYLTDSSSGWLAAMAAIGGIGLLTVFEKLWRWLVGLALVGGSWAALGGWRQLLLTDNTIVYRVESWLRAVSIWREYPWLGTGYNLLPWVAGNYNPFQLDLNQGRADSGFDSSVLTLAATSGVVGLVAFGGLVWQSLRSGIAGFRAGGFFSGLVVVTTIGLFVSSCFINSWLYPPLLWLWLTVIGFSLKEQYD